MRTGQSEETGQQKWSDTQNREENKTLVGEESMQCHPTACRFLVPRLEERDDRARDSTNECKSDEHKAGWRQVLPVPRPSNHHDPEQTNQPQEEAVPEQNVLGGK